MSKLLFEQLAVKLCEAVPGLKPELKEELQKNFRTILQNALTKMNLVSREEFEVQVALLSKARSRLSALELRLAELEEDSLSRKKQ